MAGGGGGNSSERDLQLVLADPRNSGGGDGGGGVGGLLQPLARSDVGSGAIVEYSKGSISLREEGEDLEVKLRRIIDHVPVRVSNTSGSSAGSGSGDFHQYRQMRRREQDRLTRMDIDYKRRKELAEFNMRREERIKAEEERTSKKRLKRQKKKQKKKEKSKTNDGEGEHCKEESSDHNDSDGQ